MAKVIVATMSEWHQVQRKYALEIDLAYLKDIFPDKSDEEVQQIFDDLVSGDLLVDDLEEMGYEVFAKVLNAKDFGVPQNRERIYIVAFQGNDIDFKFPEPIKKEVKLGDILESNVDSKYTISDKLWAGHKRRKEEHKQKGNGFGYSLFNKKSPYTSTISARYYKDGSEILIDQSDIGKNPRKLTPRECARIQGFPENFVVDAVSDNQIYKQFGNSVSVPVIRAIAEEMRDLLIIN